MDTQRLHRRRSRRRARRRQIAWLVIIALAVGAWVWTRILIERRNDAVIFAATAGQGVRDANGVTSPSLAQATPANATKNLIVFVGRGYGIVPMTAARIYAKGEEGALTVDGFPETALVRTYSRNAQSADAAAAMTAYMTGVRVDNGVLSQTAETRSFDEAGRPHAAHDETTCPTAGNGKPATTLLELAKASGRATGVVTTARVTEAIAAAGYAHLCHRDGENTIAAQLVPGGPGSNARLGEGLDVILGGGWQHFLPKDDPRGSSRNDTRDLFAEMRAKGYAVIGRQAELVATAAPVGKLLGLFHRSDMNHEADRFGTGEPSLEEMTSRAIDLLQRNTNGYLLIVEGGRIGQALDQSLARKALQDAHAFDDAIAAALAKVKALDPDLHNTMIVVTADHDHTLVMNGNATLAGRTIEARPGVLGVLRSYNDPTQFATDATGKPFTTLVFGAGDKRVKGARSQAPAISDLTIADKNYHYEAAIEISGAIGGTDVMLSAIGANASHFHGTIDNTQVYSVLRGAMGL
jgi:alkaline phosphatase